MASGSPTPIRSALVVSAIATSAKLCTCFLPDAEVGQVGVQCGIKLRQLRHNLAHDVKLLRLGIGKRTKQRAIYDREDGGVCADPEREGEDSDKGEAGGFAEHAQGEANVLNDTCKETPRCISRQDGLAIFLFLNRLEAARE